ncbi:hypothetical protein MHK_000064 [Candidatus Magnetomorum sp. HK-1]|nr:hypothetical protein MHK_000064 [Candidatus Magnetomorum sp. HK-1]
MSSAVRAISPHPLKRLVRRRLVWFSDFAETFLLLLQLTFFFIHGIMVTLPILVLQETDYGFSWPCLLSFQFQSTLY